MNPAAPDGLSFAEIELMQANPRKMLHGCNLAESGPVSQA